MLNQNALITGAYQIQPLPTSVQRLAALASQSIPDIAAIVDAAALDPVLTGRLLRVANSARNTRQYKAGTVKDAVMRMGSGMVLGLAMGACARPLVVGIIPGYGIRGDDFWKHAVTAALVAEVGRSFSKSPWSPAAFTAALLHDFGKIVLGNFLTEEYQASLRDAMCQGGLASFQAEYEILAVQHAEVGALIAQHWKLPDNIVQGIMHHHDPEQSTDVLGHVTHMANTVAHWLDAGQEATETDKQNLAPTLERLGMPIAVLEQLASKVAARLAELEELYH